MVNKINISNKLEKRDELSGFGSALQVLGYSNREINLFELAENNLKRQDRVMDIETMKDFINNDKVAMFIDAITHQHLANSEIKETYIFSMDYNKPLNLGISKAIEDVKSEIRVQSAQLDLQEIVKRAEILKKLYGNEK